MSANPEAIVVRALERLRAAGTAEADVLYAETESLDVRVRDDEIEHVTQSREKVLGVRAFVEGDGGLQQAVTSTSDLSDEALDALVMQTTALARATAPDPHAGLPEDGFAAHVPELGLHDPADRPFKADDRIEVGKRMERAARAVDPSITNSEGSEAGSRMSHVAYGNSRGFAGAYTTASHTLVSTPLAEKDGEMQNDYWYAIARRVADLPQPEEIGRMAGERAVRKLGARSMPTCEVPVIYEPRTAASLLGHVVACANGYAIYRRSSFLLDKLGETIASPLVTVIDDGTLPGGLGSRPFDGEGLPTRRNVLLQGGRLEQYLFDTYSARKLGAASTGSASRGAGSGPTASSTNLWLEPGEHSPEALLAGTERGLLVTELIGFGFNPVTGDYSRGAGGFWIENGELTHPVKEVTIAGNLGDMLRDVDAVGDDLLWLGRSAAPSVRISRMTVAGS